MDGVNNGQTISLSEQQLQAELARELRSGLRYEEYPDHILLAALAVQAACAAVGVDHKRIQDRVDQLFHEFVETRVASFPVDQQEEVCTIILKVIRDLSTSKTDSQGWVADLLKRAASEDAPALVQTQTPAE